MRTWKAQCCLMGHHPPPFLSKAASNRDAFSPRHSLASSSPCCYLTPSVNQKMECFSIHDLTASCSTCPACEPRQKCANSCCERCSLPTTLPWPPTHKKDCKGSSTAWLMPAENSAWSSAWRKQTRWVRTSVKRPASPSGTSPWK